MKTHLLNNNKIMPTDININDNAKTVIDRIREAINEQGANVPKPDYASNATAVVDSVNASIRAESNPSLEHVAVNDNAPVFVRKINDLFRSIREGGSTPSEPISWENVKYIACGDSITDPTITPFGLKKYCYKAAAILGIPESNVTDIGISGSTMTYSESYSVTSGNAPQLRSFLYEMVEGNETAVVPETAGNNAQYVGNGYKGPTNINWGSYDIITLMLGTNDAAYCKNVSTAFKRGEVYDTPYSGPSEFPTNKRNYFSYAYEEAILRILDEKKESAILVLCVPPKTVSISNNFDVGFTPQSGSLSIKSIIEALARKYSLPVVNFYDDIEDMTWADGSVHPDAAGNASMGSLLAQRLRGEAAASWGDQSQTDEYEDAPSILVLGNSYTLDSWSYVPYLLKQAGINIKLGLCYIASAGLDTYKGTSYKCGVNANRGFSYIDTSVDGAKWTTVIGKSTEVVDGVTHYLPTGEQCVQYNNGDWDIIVLQQTSTSSYIRSSYNGFGSVKSSISETMRAFGKTLNTDYIFGFSINHPNGGINNLPTDILLNINELQQSDSDIKIVFPYGTGIVNGRNYQELYEIGYSTFNNMTYDGAHLVGGLPHYLASITIIEALFKKYYNEYGLSVADSATIPNIDNSWVSSRTFPDNSRASISRGLTDTNISLARLAAVHAANNPFIIYCDMTTRYVVWPFMVIININENCEVYDNAGYDVIYSGTTYGIASYYFLISPGTEISGIKIRAKSGCYLSSHSWVNPRLGSPINTNFGTLNGNTEFEINGITVNTNVRITVNGSVAS